MELRRLGGTPKRSRWRQTLRIERTRTLVRHDLLRTSPERILRVAPLQRIVPLGFVFVKRLGEVPADGLTGA